MIVNELRWRLRQETDRLKRMIDMNYPKKAEQYQRLLSLVNELRNFQCDEECQERNLEYISYAEEILAEYEKNMKKTTMKEND